MRGHFLRAEGSGYDPDALTYIRSVEAADGQSLEYPVKDAINAFVLGCKADAIWTAIKASCILAGARTLSGALVPLVGAAPTNVGPFTIGDYNRKTGLVGNGTSKYLDTNRNNNADPQDSQHIAVYVSTVGVAIALSAGGNTGASHIGFGGVQSRNSSGQAITMQAGYSGVSRNSSAGFRHRTGGINTDYTQASQSPFSVNYALFGVIGIPSGTHRIQFYSIGEHLDVGLQDARIATLMSTFASSIP